MSFIEQGIVWRILSVLACFFYNIYAFQFSRRILKNFTKNAMLVPLCALANTILVIVYVSLRLPFPFLFFSGAGVFFLEFSVLSKATIRQKLFGASVFFFHIGTIHLLILVIHSLLLQCTIVDLFDSQATYSQSWFFTCVVLTIVLFALQKIVSFSDLKRVSSAKTYTKFLIIITLSIIALLTLESFFILRAEDIRYAPIITIATILFTTSIFYFFFLYSIHFINMHVYKRKKDAVVDSHTQLLIEKQRIEQEITRDSLTGLFTKRFAYEVLQTLSTTKDAEYAVLFIDLNGLKKVNDTYGHATGDSYICEVSNLIKSEIREDDIAARIGGDELLIIMESTDSDEANTIVDRIQTSAKIQNAKVKYLFAISIGIVCIDNKKEMKDFDSILALADEDMRKKKKEFYKERGSK